MSLQSSALQTPFTDPGGGGGLVGKVTGMQVLDPTEGNEKTTLLETDDEFDVKVSWELTGIGTPVVGGSWLVSLYSSNMDGTGAMIGLLGSSPPIPITGAVGPLKFHYTFKVAPPTPQAGLYKLTATINHSPTGNPSQLTEMFGYAESTPIDIQTTVVESN